MLPSSFLIRAKKTVLVWFSFRCSVIDFDMLTYAFLPFSVPGWTVVMSQVRFVFARRWPGVVSRDQVVVDGRR